MATFSVHPIEAAPVSPISPRRRWIHAVPHLDPMYGGLSSAVPELGSAIQHYGQVAATLAAFCAPDEVLPSSASNPAFRDLQVTRWPLGRSPWITDHVLRDGFRETLRGADGVHLHGLWEQSTLVGAWTARSLRKPYIVSAHGMLEPWALRNKGLKKQVYSLLAERRNLKGAACLHALTVSEAEDYRRYGTRRPIAIIPNGVEVPPLLNGDQFYVQYPALKEKRIILFLGRIHFKKGLDLLVNAWKQVMTDSPDAHLVLAGPDSEQTLPRVQRLVHDLGIADRVTFTGMLAGEAKWSALAAAECFVLPSFSEGLSVSTLEAMGVGLPVIITEHCNLPEVNERGAGWVIQSDLTQLASALRECLGNSPEQNQQIGTNGRRLIADRYTWPAIGAQMSDLYRWVLGGPEPTSFELRSA